MMRRRRRGFLAAGEPDENEVSQDSEDSAIEASAPSLVVVACGKQPELQHLRY